MYDLHITFCYRLSSNHVQKKYFVFPKTTAAYRRALLFSLGATVISGLIAKFYPGPGRSWLNDSFGGIAYEIFWMLLFSSIAPAISVTRIASGVLVGTCVLEFLQLWQPQWLQAFRKLLPVRLVLGNTFSWWDFPYYLLGCGLGWLWLHWLRERFFSRSRS